MKVLKKMNSLKWKAYLYKNFYIYSVSHLFENNSLLLIVGTIYI